MPVLGHIEQYVWWLSIGGHFVLAILFWRNGLYRTYRFFFGYLIFRVMRAALLAGVPPLVRLVSNQPQRPFANNAYAWIWIATEPLVWFFYVVVVLELYALVLQKYQGIASLSRWALMAGLAISVIASSLTLSTDLSNPSEKFRALRYVLMIDRDVASSLVIFLLMITAFLAWYPVPLSRNVVVHCIVYAVYFMSLAAIDLVRNIAGSDITQVVNVIGTSLSVICLAVWIAFIRPKGETAQVVVRRHGAAEQEQELVQQLASINSTLLRAARK